ncbi:MAG: AAA family ATPase [bacterium]|nr:AAA family ATPase [bacterium]
MFLNIKEPYINYAEISKTKYFVDKSAVIDEIWDTADTCKYICITRPRRFGKTVTANMLAAFFGKAYDSREIFEGLKISESKIYKEHLNKHDIIYIDFSRIPNKCKTYDEYIERIYRGLKNDLLNEYPELHCEENAALGDILSDAFEMNGNKKFIFILDEWDAVFHMNFLTETDKNEYLLFIKSLLKDRAYVELAYMTGVLPIAKYSSGSELNMFSEYSMTIKTKFSEYFGFTDGEVDGLYEKFLRFTKKPGFSREDIAEWYDGYHTAGGERMYNPRSVVLALRDNQLADYWTSSGPYDEIFYYIKNNIDAVRDDMALMVSGERIRVKIQNYAAAAMELKTREQIYSAMVVYGLLTYEAGKVFIPNKELMIKFSGMLQEHESLGYVYKLARESDKMLDATLAGDTETMARILQYAHNTETPIYQYNNETELSAIVNLVYLSARDRYRIEREDKAGKGFVDFIFYPINTMEDCIILELKVNHTPEEAVEQIKEKQYALRFAGRMGEELKYTGRILAVGIGYDRATKEHRCRIEELIEN